MNIYVDGGGMDRNDQSRIGVLPEGKEPILVTFNKGFTNNEAEYMAALVGAIIAQPGDTIVSDSKLVVKQGSAEWGCHAKNLRPFKIALNALYRIKNIELKWLPREKNKVGKILEQRLKKGI